MSFDIHLHGLEVAFRARLPEAPERAGRFLQRKRAELALANRRAAEDADRAERLLRQAEAGDWAYRMNGTVRDLVDEAGEWISRAMDAEGKACRLLDEIARVDAMLAQFGKRLLPDDEAGPTVELMRRLRDGELSDPMMRLCQLGHISEEQLRTGREIARLVEHATVRTGAKTMHFPTTDRIDISLDAATRRRGPDVAEWYDWLHSAVYVPWWRRNRVEARVVLALVVDGVSLETARRRYGCGWGTALRRLTTGLDDYQRTRAKTLKEGRDG